MSKLLAAIFGIVFLLIGGLWIGQGLGVIRWPSESFMIDQPMWSWNGGALALAGAALTWWSRRS